MRKWKLSAILMGRKLRLAAQRWSGFVYNDDVRHWMSLRLPSGDDYRELREISPPHSSPYCQVARWPGYRDFGLELRVRSAMRLTLHSVASEEEKGSSLPPIRPWTGERMAVVPKLYGFVLLSHKSSLR